MEKRVTKITVYRDDYPNLLFTGRVVAEVTDHATEGARQSRWTELTLYVSNRGTWICQSCTRSQWQGETNYSRAEVFDSHAGVIDFFGHSDLAKELYAAAEIEDVEVVE